ncbi:MAG: LCP family protein [Cellulosilyticaceae bacterium]
MGKQRKKGKKQKLMSVFLTTMIITLGVCGIGIGGIVVTYNRFIHETNETMTEASIENEELEKEELGKQIEAEKEGSTLLEMDKNINKTVAIFGTDLEGLRTDVIIVANFNSETNEVNVISIPRDTKVEWTLEERKLLSEKYSWVERSKINEMTVWGGMDQIRGLTVRELENILGIKIDDYVIVSLTAFREIIDAIGGVEFNVPERMKKDDFSQNLHIDLYPGIQILDGDKAEQLVRYRDYIDGDLGRIRIQQAFLTEVAKKVLSPEMIIKLPTIIPVVLKSIKTDIDLVELLSYYPYIQNFDIQNLSFYMLPGVDMYQNKISYYIADLEEVEKLINKLFFRELYE